MATQPGARLYSGALPPLPGHPPRPLRHQPGVRLSEEVRQHTQWVPGLQAPPHTGWLGRVQEVLQSRQEGNA